MTLATAVSDLLEKVPEFAVYEPQSYNDLPYDVFGSFALFLCGLLRQEVGGSVLERAFGVLNEMASSHDSDLRNLLVVGVLEVIADDEDCREKAAAHLTVDANALLRRTAAGWKK